MAKKCWNMNCRFGFCCQSRMENYILCRKKWMNDQNVPFTVSGSGVDELCSTGYHGDPLWLKGTQKISENIFLFQSNVFSILNLCLETCLISCYCWQETKTNKLVELDLWHLFTMCGTESDAHEEIVRCHRFKCTFRSWSIHKRKHNRDVLFAIYIYFKA